MGNYVKTTGGYDVKVPHSGQVNLNTVLGALGTAGFAGINLRNLVGGLFNQGAFNGMGLDAIMGMLIPMLTQMGCQRSEPACSEDHLVTRYELETENKLAAKETLETISYCKNDLGVATTCGLSNISFGLPVIESLRKKSGMVFDVHLMIEEPIRYIKEFVESNNQFDRFVFIKEIGKEISMKIVTSYYLLENILKGIEDGI